MTSLDHYLEAADAPDIEPTPETRERWSIDGDRTAGWALRRLARARGEVDRINAEADRRIALIEAWREDALRTPMSDAAFFEGALGDWHRRRLEPVVADALDTYLNAHPNASPDDALAAVWANLKGKSLKLPDGTLTARRTPDTVEVVDPDAAVTWALTEGHAHLVNLKPALAELRKLPRAGGAVVGPDGEAVPGVVPRAGRLTYGAKVDASVELPAWEPQPGAA